jgi:predicted DCC family thiol-disulfide oxidoreductase YuxK
MDAPGKIIASVDRKIILFDGVCNLCNSSVQFIIKRDKSNRFQFASLQSSFAQSQLEKLGLDANEFYSIVLLTGNKVLLRSDAALEIAKDLSGLWPAFYAMKIIPRFIRDFFYNIISKNRYAFFGRREACMIPTPEMKPKFLE